LEEGGTEEEKRLGRNRIGKVRRGRGEKEENDWVGRRVDQKRNRRG